jgi:hypothetical protein
MAASAAVAPAAVVAASTAVAASTSAAVAATAAMADELYARLSCVFAFFVEDIERRQADVGDFLLTESDLIAISGVRRRHNCRPQDHPPGGRFFCESDIAPHDDLLDQDI